MSDLVSKIQALEARLSPEEIRLRRREVGLPSVDGAPEAWLQRYHAYLSIPPLASQPTVTAENWRESLPDRDTWLASLAAERDAWWAEQAARTPRACQVWTGRGKPRHFVGSCDDRPSAELLARAQKGEWVWVLPGTPSKPKKQAPPPAVKGLRRIDAEPDEPIFYLKIGGKSESGPWRREPEPPKGWVRLQEQAKTLLAAEDGAELRALGVGPSAAHAIVEMLANGMLAWRKRRKKVPKARIGLARVEGRIVVRRAA